MSNAPAPGPSHETRLGLFGRARTVALDGDRLIVTENGRMVRSAALDAIRSIRMQAYPAGRGQQVVCRVGHAGGPDIVFASAAWTGPFAYDHRPESFRTLAGALHRALRPRWGEIEFNEGYRMSTRLMPFVPGALLAAASLWLLVRHAPSGGWREVVWPLIGLAIGGYAAFAFRPDAPRRYDPESFASIQ
ncbi:MAG: hypothetical protein KIS81_06420 [Maricaulaceae bacterium]|nr:hypothetical protein [Maricaulaceae bacterium]